MLDDILTENLWTFKYEPKTIDDYIATDETKSLLKTILKDNLNLLISGTPGTGKSTFVNIYLKQTGFDYLKINASNERGIDSIRMKVEPFAKSLGFGKFKIVYFNEADQLTQDAQRSLKDLIEEVRLHTRFIFICNDYHPIDDAIMSRCFHLEMPKPPAKGIFDLCKKIIENEKIVIKNKKDFDKSLIDTIKRFYPDIRSIINSVQGSVVDGEISVVKSKFNDDLYDSILNAFMKKDIGTVRELLRNNAISYNELYNMLFNNVSKFSSPGDAIIDIGEYLWRDKQVAIQEINFLAMMAKMIKEGTL